MYTIKIYLTKVSFFLSNIIITEDPETKEVRLKYIDFYIARQLNQPLNVLTQRMIYSEYSAPEFVLQEAYDKKIDVWYVLISCFF